MPKPPELDLIPLSKVPGGIAHNTKRRATRQTVWNWAVRGVQRQAGSESAGRLFLQTVQQGGRMVTSPAWIARFLNDYHRIEGKGNRL